MTVLYLVVMRLRSGQRVQDQKVFDSRREAIDWAKAARERDGVESVTVYETTSRIVFR